MSINDHLYYSRAIKSIQNEELIKGSDLINIIKDLSRLQDVVDGLSGGTAISDNHGNTVYVSADGDNGTGTVGNISKPFSTVQAAIAGLDSGDPGTIVILSSASAQVIDDVDYTNNDAPELLTIKDLCSCGITFTGAIRFFQLYIESEGTIIINTDDGFQIGDVCKIKCVAFQIPDTMIGTLLMLSGIINCDILVIQENTNASLVFDIVNWSKGAVIGAVNSFEYNQFTPWEFKANLTQSGTSAPSSVVLKNTLNSSYEISYNDVGSYIFACVDLIPDYTTVTFGPSKQGDPGGLGSYCTMSNVTDEFYFYTVSPVDFSPANGMLISTLLLIEIYPEKI